MSKFGACLAIGVVIFVNFSCKKDFSAAEEDPGSLSATQSSSAVVNGVHHEPFDKLPLELSWIHAEYKPYANAFAVVNETPAVGAGAAKFILPADVLVGGANKAQLVYRPNHAAGTESVYNYHVRIPSTWADRAGTSDVTLTSWNASPDPAKGETWNNMPVNKALAYIMYHAEGGKSYFQLIQGLNTTVPFEGKIWKNKIVNQVQLTKNTWYKLTIKIKWSLSGDGYVMAYMNDQLWASQTAVRTLYNTIPAYFKIGLARPVPANVPENRISVLYDDLKISTAPESVTHKIIAQNLKHPWEIAWGADNHIWFTERAGTISRLNPITGVITKVLTVFPDEWELDNTWLLGMALHPQFLQKPYVYTTYAYNRSGIRAQKVVRYTYSGGTLKDPVDIIRNINPGLTEHSGTRLLIVGDFLYVTIGDGGGGSDGKIAQRPTNMAGKVLRVLLNGGIPSTNPIPGSAVWALGFRNSQGLVYAHNKLYSTEHGPDNDDEVNIVEPNRNYGWPIVNGYCDLPAEASFCTANNVKEPLMTWTPTIAPCGIDYYNTTGPITQWRNSLLMCTLKNSRLVQLKLNADGSAITGTKDFITNTYGRLRDICISPQGKVFVSTDNGTNDVIVEISQ